MATDTRALPLLPLTTGVVLPGMVVPVGVTSPEAQAAADAAGRADGKLLLLPRLDDRYATVGTVAQVEEAGALPDGTRAVLVRGLYRAVVGAGVAGPDTANWVEVDQAPEPAATPRAAQLAREYRAAVEAVLELRGGRGVAEALRGVTEPGALADTAAFIPDLDLAQRVQILETLDVEARLQLVVGWARELLAQLQVRRDIESDVAEDLTKAQRDHVLRQQMAAIRRQLGDSEDDVAGGYRARLEEADLPEAVRTAAARELDRLERAGEQGPEAGMIRTWLDLVFDLPWSTRTVDNLDVTAAREVLNADHTGLADPKDRILEHLAVRKLRADRGLEPSAGRGSGTILALVGPPGVGKTSLGESVARALGRKFVRVALGGIRDEAEIRGHRRTYIGALPGRIVRGLREAGAANPVFLLDEVDKVGADWRGDPSSALLEVLDPAQNHTFRDHYLELDLDLSDVLFIATANVMESIPGPLLDRMEVIRLDGYTDDEKVTIGRDHLLARQLERAGLTPDELSVPDPALHRIVADYTREAGVRTLERELGRLIRKVATRLAAGDATAPITVDEGDVAGYLGRARFWHEAAERTAVPGVATGLAVTGAGGDVLFIEATTMDGEPGLTLTGQLGDVMSESARIALSYVRAHHDELGVPASALERRHLHVHVPAGAVPKDGPSAGVTMTTALVSLLTGRPVRSSVGMTGEVTLSGRVLPIGGVKQKVLAAHRAGLTEVVLPERNGPDIDDVPEHVREAMTFHLAAEVGQVLEAALEPAALPAAA
ncbi:endopeptidase La [soil metagenome]